MEGHSTSGRWLDIVPGRSIGPFVLGQSLECVVSFLCLNRKDFERIEVKFDPEFPVVKAISVVIPLLGLSLIFDPLGQNLVKILINNLDRCEIAFRGEVISSAVVPASFVSIYRILGATGPGSFVSSGSVYELEYPEGLSFRFPIPRQFVSEVSMSEALDLPLVFPDGTTPSADVICLFNPEIVRKRQNNQTEVDNLEYSKTIAQVTGVLGRGIQVRSLCADIGFSTTAQELYNLLGTPKSVFNRPDDLSIRTSGRDASSQVPSSTSSTSSEFSQNSTTSVDNSILPPVLSDMVKKSTDYFLNYPSRGLDLCIDGDHHVVKAIVLRCNMPGHWDFFDGHSRCHFVLSTSKQTEGDIFPFSKWNDVRSRLPNVSPNAPLVINRGRTSDGFMTVLLYSFKGGFAEVMKNGYIARWTLIP